MKKGFTLVELMMVIVIVGILVAIALPKYNESLERGRALEGINVLKEVSDALNAQYILDGNVYNKPSLANLDFPRAKYFSIPTYVSGSNSNVTVTRAEWGYTLTAENSNGMLDRIICSDMNDGEDCAIIGITDEYGEYGGYGLYVLDMSN